MALIKTDSQNYTDIADAIREVVGVKIFFNENITTIHSSYSGLNGYVTDLKYDDIINNYSQRVGEVFEVICDDISYFCELTTHNYGFAYYLGNLSLFGDSYPNTEEPFCMLTQLSDDESINNKLTFFTSEAKTYHFAVVKNHYKPEEMKKALDDYVADYGINFSEDGKVATTYGYKAAGLMCNYYLEEVNFSDKTLEIGKYAFFRCQRLSISTVPENVTKIGDWAFRECDSITNFIFPKNISEIGNRSFEACTLLTSVTFKGTPNRISMDTFDDCDNLTTINVPWSEGEVTGAPWGATNATINYNYVAQ